MKRQYHFCFVFTRIQLLNQIHQTLDFFTNFKFHLLHNGSMIGQTNDILCITNSQNEIVFEKEEIRCSVNERDVLVSPHLEIRLTQILSNSDEKLIGSYQFGINNYIHISDHMNRHRVELSIQIGQNYAIYYEVFMDRFREGVDQVIQQHRFSKKLIKNETDTEDFLPEEIQFFPSRPKNKEIKLDSENLIVINQRFWSPTWLEMHNQPKKETKRRILTKKNSINDASISKNSRQNNQSISDLKLFESTMDDQDNQKRLPFSQIYVNELPILQPSEEESYQSQIEQKIIEVMYETIHSNSKIQLPVNKPAHQFDCCKMEQKKMPIKTSRKSKNIKYLKKYFIFFLITLLFAMLVMQTTTKEPRKKQKRHIKKQAQYSL